MGQAEHLYDEAVDASKAGLRKVEGAARRGLEHLGDSAAEMRDTVVPMVRNMGSRVAQVSDRTIGYVREQPVRSVMVAAAVGTLIFAAWQMLSTRQSR